MYHGVVNKPLLKAQLELIDVLYIEAQNNKELSGLESKMRRIALCDLSEFLTSIESGRLEVTFASCPSENGPFSTDYTDHKWSGGDNNG